MAAGVFGPCCEVALSNCAASRGVVGTVKGTFERDGGEGGDSDAHQGRKIGSEGWRDVDAGWWRFRCWHRGRVW